MQLLQPQPQPQLLVLLLLLLATDVSSSPLDPKQLKLLHSLNIKDPCNNHNSSTITITCDTASPYRHITSISFNSCSSLSPPHHLPISLHSFSAVSSFLYHRRQLSGLFLARLVNLKNLEISSTPISTSNHLYVILGNMRKLTSLTISNSNLSGKIPKSFHSNLITHIDLSKNSLKGSIHNSITHLSNLKSLNLSHNLLSGQIPYKIGNLLLLNNLSLASNTLSGTIPNSLISISQLTHLDLSMNQLNGTVPMFLSEMKNLKHLNLSGNSFNGVLPFNESFIKNLEVFEIGGNSDLCYNDSVISSRLKLGIAPCDKYGLVEKEDYGDYDNEEGNEKKEKKKKEEEGRRTQWFKKDLVWYRNCSFFDFVNHLPLLSRKTVSLDLNNKRSPLNRSSEIIG